MSLWVTRNFDRGSDQAAVRQMHYKMAVRLLGRSASARATFMTLLPAAEANLQPCSSTPSSGARGAQETIVDRTMQSYPWAKSPSQPYG